MPLYYFKCVGCKTPKSVICKSKDLKKPRFCLECGQSLVRAPKGFSSNITETLDNGIMVRKIERIAGAEEIFKERAKKDSREKGFKAHEDDVKETI